MGIPPRLSVVVANIKWGCYRSNSASHLSAPFTLTRSTPRRQRRKLLLLCHLTSLHMPPKSSRIGWKTGEQLEFLRARWGAFKRAQDDKRLDPFWARVLDDCFTHWPVPSTPSLFREYKSVEEGREDFQKKKTAVRDSPDLLHPSHANRNSLRKSNTGSATRAVPWIRRRDHAGI